MIEKRKKILMITSSTVGGGPNQLFLLATELQHIYEISIAAPLDDLYLEKLKKISLSKFLSVQSRAFNLFDLAKIIYFLITNEVSIIHSHGKAAGVLGRISSLITGIPLIHTFHGIHISGKRFLSRIIYIFYEKVFGNIDYCSVYVSQSEKNMSRNYFTHSSNLSLIIPNGVINDDNTKNHLSTKINFRSKLNISNDVILVVTVCSLESVKNLFEILKIAKLCPDLVFCIIGEGSLLYELKKWIHKNKIYNVILPGFFREPREILYASDIYLSSSFREGHPLSILEAMSVGLPVIASNVAGNDQTIENGKSGFYYKLGDIKEASNYLTLLATDSNIRLSFGTNARILQRKKFSSNIMAERYRKLYLQINNI